MKELDIIEFIPSKLDHRDVFVSVENGNLIISCNKTRPPYPIKIKNKLILDSKLFEMIGLYFGDGFNRNKGSSNRKVGIANNCPKLHNDWISFLERIGVSRNKLYIQIQIGSNITNSHEEIRKYWSESLFLPLSCFSPKINVKDCKTKEYGLAVVCFHNKIFRKISENLFSHCIELIKKNKEFATSFLRGLFAAEGYSATNRCGSLCSLDIPIISDSRRDYVEKLFLDLGLRCTNNGTRIIFSGYIDFKKFRKLGLHKMHPDRCARFERAYKHLIEKGHVPALTKLKIINCLGVGGKNRYEISNLLELDISTVYKSLKDLEVKKVVRCSGKSLSSNNRKLRKTWELVNVPDEYSLMNNDYGGKL